MVALGIHLEPAKPDSLPKYRADEVSDSYFKQDIQHYIVVNGNDREFVNVMTTVSVLVEKDQLVFIPYCYVLISEQPIARLAEEFFRMVLKEYHVPVELQKIAEITGKLQARQVENKVRLEYLLSLIWNQNNEIV